MSVDRLYQRAPRWVQTLLLNAYATRISYRRRGQAFRHAVAQLLESERWTRGRMDAYQDDRVRHIVRHAFANSPYYRDMMKSAGVTPSDIAGTADLRRLPLLTKEIVRTEGARMFTRPQPSRDWLQGRTSGTTGYPLSLWYDPAMAAMNDAVDWRQKVWSGMTTADWLGVFLGRIVIDAEQPLPPFWRINYLHRHVMFSSYHMSDDNLSSYVAEIRRRRLRFLEGYPSTLFVLARHVLARGTTLPMRAVLSSSETMHDVQRETIESAFQCRVFDFLGHAERTIFAAECERHDGKHLAEEYGFTEVVNDRGEPVPDGELGYLVGTSLHNVAMPMIRYRTGDVSSIQREPCECGRILRRIAGITTKAQDILRTPDGRMVPPTGLTNSFRPFQQIVTSQIVQERLDHVTVRIVLDGPFTGADEAALREALAYRLGRGITIGIQVVDEIPREKSGKLRWVISEVPEAVHFSGM